VFVADKCSGASFINVNQSALKICGVKNNDIGLESNQDFSFCLFASR
jgi:hypothetical protein